MTAPLAATGLRFGYTSERPVLDGVDLEVRPGEVLGLIGPNGSGKTTLLRLLAGGLAPDAGGVALFGHPLQEYSSRERARLLAVVPQETAVAFPFRALEVALMGRFPHLGRWQLEGRSDLAAAREALSLTGVLELADRRCDEISGGERQRVMIAKALAQEPKVLLLDEPTAFLDLRHQVEVYGLVRRLAAERGLTALAVSHDINLAALYCDRIAALSAGRVEKVGTPAEVLTEERLSRVYGVRVAVTAAPGRAEAPLAYPLPEAGGGA